MKQFIIMIVMLLCFSCSDEVGCLKFEKSYYEVPLLAQNQYIEFDTSFIDLDVIVENESILSAEINGNKLIIHSKTKGKTIIKIKNKYNEVQISVKVVDSYLGFNMEEPIVINGKFVKGDRLFLINNSNKDFYVFSHLGETKKQGTYFFDRKDEKIYLTLDFGEGKIVYDISGSSYELIHHIFPMYLDIDYTKSREVMPLTMRAVDIETGATYCFIVDKSEIPYNVL